MSRSPEIEALALALVGRWSGTGTVSYPTIETFEYREEFVVSERSDHPALHIDQRTWKQTEDDEVPSHWETGLLRLSSDGTARFLNAQGGRAEAMDGGWRPTAVGWEISLASHDYAGDTRVVRSSRRYEVGPNRIGYRMSMATTNVPDLTAHLSASLTRS